MSLAPFLAVPVAGGKARLGFRRVCLRLPAPQGGQDTSRGRTDHGTAPHGRPCPTARARAPIGRFGFGRSPPSPPPYRYRRLARAWDQSDPRRQSGPADRPDP
ncbi:MAG: hypothetical protein B7X76_05845, partial [Azorhizobium sp. 39-67-5]